MPELLELPSTIELNSPVNEQALIKKEGFFKKFIKEPFVHFILLGLVIYFIADYIKERQDSKRYEIVVSDADLLRIASLWEKQYGTIPSQKELDNLVNNFIKEEIFYREGVEMGLDKEDEVIRRRIIQKMEFLQQDLAIVKEPTEEDLKDYFDKNKSKYRVPAKISFTHVFFSPDKGGDQAAIGRAEKARIDLIAKNITRNPEAGDNFPFLFDYSDISEVDLQHLLGESPLSEQAFALPASQWSGPLKSGYGYHLLYLTSKKPTALPDLSEIREKLNGDYLEGSRTRKNDEAFEKIKKRYAITKPKLDELK